MKFEELTERVIGYAYKVHNAVCYSYLESVYEKCLMIELKKDGLMAISQKPVSGFYGPEYVEIRIKKENLMIKSC